MVYQSIYSEWMPCMHSAIKWVLHEENSSVHRQETVLFTSIACETMSSRRESGPPDRTCIHYDTGMLLIVMCTHSILYYAYIYMYIFFRYSLPPPPPPPPPGSTGPLIIHECSVVRALHVMQACKPLQRLCLQGCPRPARPDG